MAAIAASAMMTNVGAAKAATLTGSEIGIMSSRRESDSIDDLIVVGQLTRNETAEKWRHQQQ